MSDFSPVRKLMRHFGGADNRETYLDIAYLGHPPVDADGNLHPDLEACLPERFQRARLNENVLTEEEQ
jgi:hypothetical protein